ncbi:TIGR03862 family flavoprotein [Pseudoduganella sp. DS3]|uniref:TIGR03862 family flavoprotein n=1 Tax=Pseudoduganella guangdongensis TaxID=2692179 RepID=A0A6N9HJB7_9BURK|nr:TIGR03862 family flavoprotein [Pseudoduganella guangdongensis]MYN03678.1 TIGR03862 family flavoprotein [Pseudoduganella guangdongensis]
MESNHEQCVAVIGGGPAGLMAAEVMAAAGVRVAVYDAMPSVGRKFLLAGRGGMNITHAEPYEQFMARYGSRAGVLRPMLDAFTPDDLRGWVHGLGIDTFVGTSGRVFPTEMKAAPMLRAWLHRLRESGVHFHQRHRWLGLTGDGALRIAAPDGEHIVRPAATVLALGGASWARLGSDGAWQTLLAQHGVEVAPLVPANCGFDARWSEHFSAKYAGQPLTTVAIGARKGQLVITASGVEGSLIYAVSAGIRDRIAAEGRATIELDLLPDWPLERLQQELSHPRGSRSMSSFLQSRVNIKGVKIGLLHEVLDKEAFHDPLRVAATLKALPVILHAPRPIDEAISSAGGVRFEALQGTMLKALPGTFVAGEMLDWEAPTGGYLLTACFASGLAAGRDVLRYLVNPAHAA